MKFKTVLFDFYNTLVYVDPEIRAKTVEILSNRAGVEKSDWENIANKLLSRYFKGQIKSTKEYYTLILKELHVNPTQKLLDELEELEYANRYAAISTYPETHQVLTQLKQLHIKLGLISNCSCTIFRILEFVKLNKYFDVLALSCEVGVLKPAPEIYLYALKKLDMMPQEAIFVGDGDHEELNGAKDVGITTCKINQKIGYGKRDKQSTYSDFEINNLNELLNLLL
jgi:putative hydrolase of the HAD superfamily